LPSIPVYCKEWTAVSHEVGSFQRDSLEALKMEVNMRGYGNFGGYIKIILMIMVCVSMVFLFTTSDLKSVLNAFAEEQEEMSETEDLDTIVIDNKDYEKDRKGPVIFPHLAHARDYKILCWDCHHEYDDGENIYEPWVETLACIDCHDPYEKFDTIVKLQTAYHLSCKGCHEEMKIYGDEPLAYRKCNRCHEDKK
jgi:hypothetical protein